MSEGCTSCGNKGGCDHRKTGMFAAIGEAIERLYPSRRWGERDDAAAFRNGVPPETAAQLAQRLAPRLGAMTLVRPGVEGEWCDWVYALCFGRQPSILEVLLGTASADASWLEAVSAGGELEELYLRVALSTVAPFAAVQQVAMRMSRTGDDVVVVEAPRTGVFDPILLPRFSKLVAVLAELEVRHLDFGDLTTPPPGFEPGDYAERFGGAPTTANYLFFPQPAAAVSTTVLPLVHADRSR